MIISRYSTISYIYIYLLLPFVAILYLGNLLKCYFLYFGLFFFKLDCFSNKSHDKYQSLILIGLALTGKASSGIQYILFHFRSYWRGWRPLVTPWACCIKEGIEPRISQKLNFTLLRQILLSNNTFMRKNPPPPSAD